MAIMMGIDRLWQTSLLAMILGMAALGWAQDAPETPSAPAQADNPAVTAAPDESGLASQVEQLRSEVDQLRQQVATLSTLVEQLQDGRSPVVEKPAAAKRPATSKATAASKKKIASLTPAPAIAPEVDERATPMTVLVFHDGHRTEARNYAIVGQTLWIYTETDSKKMPLADLDVAATKDANSDRGITFQLPPTK